MKRVINRNGSKISPLAIIDEKVSIEGENITIEDNVVIQGNTNLSARNIHIGNGTLIEENCNLRLTGNASELFIGENCFIGHDTKIVCPVFKTGDYVKINNHTFCNGLKPCKIGHNVWVGQNCILNSYDNLTIGNGVGIGTYSSIWTHAGHGELLEGCTVLKFAPVTIEDDVWILGSYNVISPGVTIGKKSVIITGSVVTRDVLPNSVVAGNPAKNISDKISFYKEITIDKKFDMMYSFMEEFVQKTYPSQYSIIKNGWLINCAQCKGEIIFKSNIRDKDIVNNSTKIFFVKRNQVQYYHPNTTIFDLSSKKYIKQRTLLEIQIIKSLLYNKARFLPS